MKTSGELRADIEQGPHAEKRAGGLDVGRRSAIGYSFYLN